MSNESDLDSEFESLSALLQSTCSACGAKNALRAGSCQDCGAEIKQKESDRESLSFLHAEGLDSDPIAGTTSHKLKRLKLALTGYKDNEFSIPVYRAVVEQVLREGIAIQQVLEMQTLREVEKRVPEEIVDVMRDTKDHVDAFCQGCRRMLLYDGQNDVSQAEEGLAMAEAAVLDMEETQRELEILKRAPNRTSKM